MARSEGTKTPIEASLLDRVVSGVRYILGGRTPNGWMGPSQPVAPVAQAERGRAMDYPVGINLRYTPKADGGTGLTFPELRALADNCDLVRLAIETRKDQICRMSWEIRPRDRKKLADSDPRCKELTDLLQFPDHEHDWQQWLRLLVEDLLVIDAPTVYPRMTRGGDLYSLDVIDGATIKRVLNIDGRTPVPPEPAYQQILKGLPAVDYHRDELIYVPRNPRPNRIYGMSPVEQVVMTVNICIRRQITQLQYYTEGNIPDALYAVPEDWSPQQIKDFQEYWDGLLEGNTAERRHAKFVPGGIIVSESRNPKLKDEYDEWLARVICFAFSLPPTAFVKQMNRSTSEAAKDSADEEGIAPLQQWVASLMNRVLARWCEASDLEFAWREEDATSPLDQASISKIYVDAKVMTPDEVRENLGMQPLTPEQKEELNPPPPPGMGLPGQPGAHPAPGKEATPPAKDGGDPAGAVSKKKSSSPSTVIAPLSPSRGKRFTRY